MQIGKHRCRDDPVPGMLKPLAGYRLRFRDVLDLDGQLELVSNGVFLLGIEVSAPDQHTPRGTLPIHGLDGARGDQHRPFFTTDESLKIG